MKIESLFEGTDFCVPDKAAAEAEQDSFLQLLKCRNYLKTPIFPDWIQHRGNN